MLEGSIELVLSLLLTIYLVFKYADKLRQHKKIWYTCTSCLSIVSFTLAVIVFLDLLDVSLDVWWVRVIRTIVSGYLPASVFMVVMYIGVLPKTNRWYIKLKSVRTELSILGVILYLPHTILYTVYSAPYGITQLLSGEFDWFMQLMTWTGIINTVLLLILGITSNRKIRKKLGHVRWQKIQNWSYLFYFSCFVHYMTLSSRGGHYERCVIYLIVYGSYLYLRLSKNYQYKRQTVAML